MFIKSSIVACFLAGIVMTHAVPLGSHLRDTIEKRHKPGYAPQLVPEGVGRSPFEQAIICLVNAALHPPANQHDELTASETLEHCWELATASTTSSTTVNIITPITTGGEDKNTDDSDDKPTGPQTGPKGQQGTDTATNGGDADGKGGAGDNKGGGTAAQAPSGDGQANSAAADPARQGEGATDKKGGTGGSTGNSGGDVEGQKN